MERHRCAACGMELAGEGVRYEAEDDSPLCEECFREARPRRRPVPAGFTLLRIASMALKIISGVALIAAIGIAHGGYEMGAAIPAAVVFAGGCLALFFFSLGELIRLGLGIFDRVELLAEALDRSGREHH
ncbi:MAG: hypothetical protein NT045_01265 [Candidatus Aureabacteria bacterium]|nr:hypothetical protein [Candidatus Auribacterota bacterium]